MILEEQEKYLSTLPDERMTIVSPFDPKARETGLEIVEELRRVLPDLRIVFGGAAALGIAGQNDIDINILSTPIEYDRYAPIIEQLYGTPAKRGTSIKWAFPRNGFDVELYLTDKDSPMLQEQLRVFELLSNSPQLRAEYEQVKMPLGPIDFKEYMRKKYAFYNRILGLSEQ